MCVRAAKGIRTVCSFSIFDFFFTFCYRQEKKNKPIADERKVRVISLCFGLFRVRVITGEEINDKRV